MQKLIFIGVLVFVGAISAFANETTDLAARKAKALERKERYLRATGGRISKPGTPTGKIRFISSVKEVNQTLLEKQYHQFKLSYPFDIAAVVGEPVSVETASATRKRLGFELAVFIEDAPFPAPMLVAPEERWAIVNYRICVTPERTAKQAMKAFAMIAGAANSSYGISFLSSTHPQELDSIAEVDLPIDVAECIRKQLAIIKVSPEIKATYKRACEEGWAPAPTNEYQKAIWDKVHAIPKNPMKIEFDPKKGR